MRFFEGCNVFYVCVDLLGLGTSCELYLDDLFDDLGLDLQFHLFLKEIRECLCLFVNFPGHLHIIRLFLAHLNLTHTFLPMSELNNFLINGNFLRLPVQSYKFLNHIWKTLALFIYMFLHKLNNILLSSFSDQCAQFV